MKIRSHVGSLLAIAALLLAVLLLTAGGGLAKGIDLAPALHGLPSDLCPCPHWGYMLKGRLRMKTAEGDQVFEAGDAFYWGPGHAPEALEDCEYVDFSPTAEFEPVLDHLTGQGRSGSGP